MIEHYDYERAVIGLLSAHYRLPKVIILRGVYMDHPAPRKPQSVITKRTENAISELASRKDIHIDGSMVCLNTPPRVPIEFRYARCWRAIYDRGPVSRATLRSVGIDMTDHEIRTLLRLGVIKARESTTPLGKPVVRYEAVAP